MTIYVCKLQTNSLSVNNRNKNSANDLACWIIMYYRFFTTDIPFGWVNLKETGPFKTKVEMGECENWSSRQRMIGTDWTDLAQDMNKLHALVKTVINLPVP